MSRKIVKRNTKDSVFTNLFQEPEYVVQLYKALHPDEDVTEDMIEIVTLKNILVDGIYNDLGFTIGKRLVVLVEAQSTWTVNIIIRGLMYLVQTYHDYIRNEELNFYGSKKIDLPRPELYVIYTGDKTIDKDYITLSEEFFGGEETALEVRVRVLSDGKQGDIINQYVTFTKIYNEQIQKYGRTREAVSETIRICKDENILKEYLSKHEREVRDIMFALFDDEQILDAYTRDVLKKGRDEGMQKGIQEGMQKGIQEGMQKGIQEGMQKGIQDNTRKIAFKLLKKNRSDEDIIDTLDISVDELQQLKNEYTSTTANS